ncbi:shikimate dehydrogenase [Sporosarcina limicola]|uniref:Shikimate dehydrogenase (NADP(+)) n=1 Tax=Sporosarcina limicola TaxID=34101 RepID=A0A927R660_9BACL|nr:shikimate dehydrogenase [Sporosarcina limicola]MBE1554639.1 shikimate dehydrogenase [Sporosarcina limicola]
MKKWYAVLGDPIAQSMSPAMHEAWFSENNIDASYIPIHVPAQGLGEAVTGLKRLGCSGWNVTVPHKSAIIPFLDHLEPSARQMNAVNTVHVLQDGSLVGSNTDGLGFVRSLEEAHGALYKGGDVLIIGAGGAARGIAYALHSSGYGPITFTNRTMDKAEELAQGLSGTSVLSVSVAEASLEKFSLIVQTTSVGMNFAQQGMPLAISNVAEGAVLADIIYNPLETEFLKEARNRGAKTMNGVGMFVHQGALSFETWTVKRPATKEMIGKITTTLGGISC